MHCKSRKYRAKLPFCAEIETKTRDFRESMDSKLGPPQFGKWKPEPMAVRIAFLAMQEAGPDLLKAILAI